MAVVFVAVEGGHSCPGKIWEIAGINPEGFHERLESFS